MQQHQAVRKALLSVQIEGIIPPHLIPFLRPVFTQLYAAGWQECYDDLKRTSSAVWVAQIGKDNKVKNIFHSIQEANRVTGFSVDHIGRFIKKGTFDRQGFRWEKVPQGKGLVVDQPFPDSK